MVIQSNEINKFVFVELYGKTLILTKANGDSEDFEVFKTKINTVTKTIEFFDCLGNIIFITPDWKIKDWNKTTFDLLAANIDQMRKGQMAFANSEQVIERLELNVTNTTQIANSILKKEIK